MVATNGAKLPTVNFTYTNVWPLVLVDTTDPNLETPNVPVIVDVTPPEVDTLASHSETGPDEKQCSTCCKLVVDIKTNEAIQLPNVTVSGVLVTASDVVGGDEVWQATVELCDATIPAGPIGVCVDMLDLAGNSFSSCDPVGPDEGDDELVDRVYGDVVPLRACLMSNRAGFPGLGKAGDTLSLQLDTSGVVTISSVEIGPARYPADVTVAPYSGHVLDANGRAMRWQADTGVIAAWGDLDPVPWSISFVDPAGARTTLNNITGCFSGDPEKVVVDNTPPFPLLLNVTTDSPWDPVASNPYEITLCVVASEPIKAPTTVLTGFGPFPDGAVVGGGDTWCMGPRVVLPGDSDFVDQNGCITFSVILTDLAGNAGVALTALVGQDGTSLCPTTRVTLDLIPPIFLWLNTEQINAKTMVFDAALNEPCEVFFVALPQGSAGTYFTEPQIQAHCLPIQGLTLFFYNHRAYRARGGFGDGREWRGRGVERQDRLRRLQCSLAVVSKRRHRDSANHGSRFIPRGSLRPVLHRGGPVRGDGNPGPFKKAIIPGRLDPRHLSKRRGGRRVRRRRGASADAAAYV